MPADVRPDVRPDVPADPRPTVEHAWRAMGSDASVVIVTSDAALVDRAVTRVEELEERWSRFRPSSEISALNARAGQPVEVSPDTMTLVETAIDAWRATNGAFDPLVGDAVIAAGYDRTIADVQSGPPAQQEPSAPSVGCGQIVIDRGTNRITLPEGARFDPGGLGKGLAADLVVADLLAAGADGACVELGGDVRVGGLGPDRPEAATDGEPGWTVGIADPFSPEVDTAVATLADGAVATSSTLKRRWKTNEGDAHHLIDPRTGRSTTTSVVTATIIARNGATAETAATASIVAGAEEAVAIIEGLGAAGLVVEADGTRTIVGPFEAFLVEPFALDGALENDEVGAS